MEKLEGTAEWYAGFLQRAVIPDGELFGYLIPLSELLGGDRASGRIPGPFDARRACDYVRGCRSSPARPRRRRGSHTWADTSNRGAGRQAVSREVDVSAPTGAAWGTTTRGSRSAPAATAFSTPRPSTTATPRSVRLPDGTTQRVDKTANARHHDRPLGARRAQHTPGIQHEGVGSAVTSQPGARTAARVIRSSGERVFITGACPGGCHRPDGVGSTRASYPRRVQKRGRRSTLASRGRRAPCAGRAAPRRSCPRAAAPRPRCRRGSPGAAARRPTGW